MQGIAILDEKKARLAYVRFDFDSGVDQEHGVAVVLHGTTPVGLGGAGEDDLGLALGEHDEEAAEVQRALQPNAQALAAALSDARNGDGIRALSRAAAELPPGRTLRLTLRIETPPVRRLERLWYGSRTCRYDLSVDVGGSQTTINATDSPAQDYLRAGPWPLPLFAPILQWPQLTPFWDTVQVLDADVAKSMRLNKWVGTPRPDLHEAAAAAWRQGLDAQEAATRGVAPLEDS